MMRNDGRLPEKKGMRERQIEAIQAAIAQIPDTIPISIPNFEFLGPQWREDLPFLAERTANKVLTQLRTSTQNNETILEEILRDPNLDVGLNNMIGRRCCLSWMYLNKIAY